MKSLCVLLITCYFLLDFWSEASVVEDGNINATVLYEWVQMDYDWEEMGVSASDWEQQGLYIAQNCILGGIKQWQDRIFVTIPRWSPGVPATLNEIVVKNGIPLLRPFPPVEYQMINTTTGLKYVQDIEIDPLGRMWVIDTGALNFYFPSQYVWNTPRLIVYDLTSPTPKIYKEYSLPSTIAAPHQTFLNDIVVDVINDFAYITNSQASGGIYIYNFKENTMRFWTDSSTEVEPNGTNFTIVDSGDYTVVTPSDGIALSTDVKTLFYCPLSGFTLYALPTYLLRNFSVTDEELHNAVVVVGQKLSQSDGLAIDSNNIMYYGNIENNSINYWNASLPAMTAINQNTLYTNNSDMQWQDTFGFDNTGSLLLVSNKLQLAPTSYDFTGNSGMNFRIYSFDINAYSYMQGALNYVRHSSKNN